MVPTSIRVCVCFLIANAERSRFTRNTHHARSRNRPNSWQPNTGSIIRSGNPENETRRDRDRERPEAEPDGDARVFRPWGFESTLNDPPTPAGVELQSVLQ